MMRLARCRFSVGIIPTTGNRQPTTRRSRNHLRLDRLRVRADIDLDLLRLLFLEEVEAAEKGLEETGLKRTEVFEGIGGSGNKCHRSLLYRDMSLSRSYHH